MTKLKWTKEEDGLYIRLFNDGTSYKKMVPFFKNRSKGSLQMRREVLGLPNRTSRWTKQDDDTFRKMKLEGKSIKEISAAINKPKSSVRSTIARLKVYSPKLKKWTDEEDTILRQMNLEKKSIREISIKLNRSWASVSHRSLVLGFQSPKDRNCIKDFESEVNDKLYKDIIQLKLKAAKRTSVVKNMEFLLTEQDIIEAWKKQRGKCFYSGIDMLACGHKLAWSIDRIDSNKGYEPSNIVLACSIINKMKWHQTSEDFIYFCKKVAEHNSTTPANIAS